MKPLNFCFCGGEPLLRYDLILDALKIFKSNHIRTSMVSNGFLLTAEKARVLFDTGLVGAQISVDGSTAETHERMRGKKGSFARALDGLRYYADAGFTDISVAFSPTSFNIHQFEEVFLLAVERGANNVRVQPLMPIGRFAENPELLPTPSQYRKLYRTVERLRQEYPAHAEWGDPINHLLTFRSDLQHCIAFASVTADGGIEPSPYLPVTVGNIRRHKFSEYWDGGLAGIWEDRRLQKMAREVNSIAEMDSKIEDRRVWWDEPLAFDLIEDNIEKEHVQ